MPREQLMCAPNPRQVSDEDLIAILLRTGSHGCDVKELARRLIGVFGSLKTLITSDWRTIENRVKEYNKQNPDRRLKGFGRVKCLELSAAFELGYRRQRLSPDDLHNAKVRTAADAYAILSPYFAADDEQENVFVLPLDADRRPICEPFLVSAPDDAEFDWTEAVDFVLKTMIKYDCRPENLAVFGHSLHGVFKNLTRNSFPGTKFWDACPCDSAHEVFEFLSERLGG